MAKKKKKFQETTISDYYDLKVDKIDELVAALRDDGENSDVEISMNISDCTGVSSPENVTKRGKQKQFDPYKIDAFSRIPTWIKAIFVKWWFSGAVCYFIVMGLGYYVIGVETESGVNLDLLALTGLALGLVVDVLVNPLFKYMESDRREYDDYMMFPFPFKAFWTFFANLIYYLLVMICVSYSYFGINELVKLITHATDEAIPLGVEPLLFATFATAVDMIFIGIKDGVVRLIKKLRKKETAANV